MRTIGVVTVARSDYGILRPVLEPIAADDELELALYVSGTHLSPAHGNTIDEIRSDGFRVAARVPLAAASDDPAAIDNAIGDGVSGFGAAFAQTRPDVLLLLGDRFEMLAAALAALPFKIPLAHVHGGESSEGAFDDAIRHALSKLSHLHFVSTEQHARRLRQLGEEPWRITVSGAPGVDAIAQAEPVDDGELETSIGMSLNGSTLLVTYHPATLDSVDAASRTRALLSALDAAGHPIVFTAPNADPGGEAVRALLEQYVEDHADARIVSSLGSRAYVALMRRVAAMVGNSSSGLIEAPSVGLPVVNVGARQDGRLRAANVVDVADDEASILAGIERALAPEFRASLAGIENPYGDGRAAGRIVDVLRRVELGQELLVKRFQDVDG